MAKHGIEAFWDKISRSSKETSETMSVVLSESDIPGSSLNGRNPSELKNDELRFWLKRRDDLAKGLRTIAEFLSGKLVLFDRNLVPRAHVPFGQHQDMELWNNQFPETKILGLPASQRMRGFVYMASRDRVDVDTFHKKAFNTHWKD